MQRFTRRPEATTRARRLRRDATDVERKLWSKLRGAQMNGVPFRRQHTVGPFVIDFYCAPLKLAIELDGGQHAERAGYDKARTQYLEGKGIRVVRFWNGDVTENFDGDWQAMQHEIPARRHELTPSLTLPLSGGGNPFRAGGKR